MPISRSTTRRRRKQAGYSLLMMVFMVATIVILAAVGTQSVLTQGRREREAETVWRGEQYERAIGLYYKKFGRYPTKMDDLIKQTNGLRFLRQAYTDPNNKDDGSWRFIYVGPNGQLIGSLRSTSLLQSVMSSPTLPGGSGLGGGIGGGLGSVLSGAMGSGAGTGPGTAAGTGFGAAPGAGAQSTSGAGSTTSGAAGTTGVGQPGQPTNGASTPDSLESQPQPLEGAVLGGNIIGVGSKIKQPSLMIYEGGITYQQWEFIWNPNTQIAIPGQNSANPVAPPAQTPTTPAAGTQPPATATPTTPTMPIAPSPTPGM